MKRSLKEFTGYTINTKGGGKGNVKDFLFDEDRWMVRYLGADLGLIFSGKTVLIPKRFVKKPNWLNQSFTVDVDKIDAENFPELSEKLPISRKYEQEINKHFKTTDYWTDAYNYIAPVGAPGITYPPRPIRVPSIRVNEKKLNTNLRSFEEIKGYHIHALDGKIGHIVDIIVDDTDWQIVYLVIDTSNWLPWSKKVLIGAHMLDEISYEQNEIKINLRINAIKSAPEFDSSEPINEEYEKRLYDYYGRPLMH
jgi:hypothetical protein